jgi:demethoxyubiquinone hydroxylase (CLK1/Coq7/Cat5 family)
MREYTADERRAEHEETLRSSRRRYGIDARTIFWLEDRVWGAARTLGKFKAQELVARSPYRAWEGDDDPTAATEAANERAHWSVLRVLIDEDGINESTVRYGVLPLLGAIGMFAYTSLLVRVQPERSYRLNADIEDRAEHEYAAFVAEHPEWEARPYDDGAIPAYGAYESRNDVLRQISLDEREHKRRSIERAVRSKRASDRHHEPA